MYRLIIVDDELLVRLGIKSFIESGSDRYEIAGTFANGKEALEYCLASPPDIILTDIAMPVMDGLEMIQKIKETFPDIIIVVLSCHEDYHLVKSAFKLGALDYVSKNEMEQEDLIRILDKIVADSYHRKNLSLQPENAREQQLILLNTLVDGSDSDALSLNEQLKQCQLKIFPNHIFVLKMALDDGYDENYEKAPCPVDSHLIIDTVHEILNKYDGGVAFIRGQEIVGILSFLHENSERVIHEKLSAMIEDLKSSFKNFFNCNLSVGVSNEHHSLPEIRQAYGEAGQALIYKFYRGAGGTVYYYDVAPILARDNSNHSHDLPAVREIAISRQNYEYDKTAVLRFYEDYFEALAARMCCPPDAVKRDVSTSLYILLDAVGQRYQSSGASLADMPNWYKLVDQFDDILILRRWLGDFLSAIGAKILELRDNSKTIYKIREYIEAHYCEDLSLQAIAAEFHLNMNYFCQYFKKETGVNFVDYLTGLRIEKAKLLLKQGSLTTAEIAAQVGFDNVNYFIKVFKKVTGRGVGEFKKAAD